MHFIWVHFLVFLVDLCPYFKYTSLTTISPTPQGKCCFFFFIFWNWICSTEAVSHALQQHENFWKDAEHSNWVCDNDRSVLLGTSNRAWFEDGKVWAVCDVKGKSWPDRKDGVKLHTEPSTLLLRLTCPCSHKDKSIFQSWIPWKIPVSL